jgi:hypothetical protein
LRHNVAYAVNERGEIAGLGTNAAGELHAFILVPDEREETALRPTVRDSAATESVIRTSAFRRIGDGLRMSGLGHAISGAR